MNCFGTIWSVSTFTRSMGKTSPVCFVKACTIFSGRHRLEPALLFSELFRRFHVPVAYVDEMTFDSCGCGHDRTDQVGPAILALAAFEVSIGSAGRALTWRKHVRIHREAHAASRIAPLKSSIAENLVESFRFGLRFNQHRSWHDEGLLDALGYM